MDTVDYLCSKPLDETADCHTHGGHCKIKTDRTGRIRIHVAGTECPDHSMMNQKREGMSGRRLLSFIAWAAFVRQQNYHVVIHECVPGFPAKILRKLFRGFHMETRCSCPKDDLGGVGAHPRRYSVLRHRTKCQRTLFYGSAESWRALVMRKPVATGQIYCEAPPDLVDQHIEDAAQKAGLPPTQSGNLFSSK